MNETSFFTQLSNFASENMTTLTILLILMLIGLWLRAKAKNSTITDPFENLRLELAGKPLSALKQIFQQIETDLKGYSNQGKDFTSPTAAQPSQITQATGASTNNHAMSYLVAGAMQIIANIDERLARIGRFLQSHIRRFIDLVRGETEHEREKYGYWRIAGALICLVLLIIFILADISLTLNNFGDEIAEITPTTETEDSFVNTLVDTIIGDYQFGDITQALVISSIGTAFTLGFIVIDALGITHFVPWTRIYTKYRRPNNDVSSATPQDPNETSESTPANYQHETKIYDLRGFIKFFSIVMFLFNLAIVCFVSFQRGRLTTLQNLTPELNALNSELLTLYDEKEFLEEEIAFGYSVTKNEHLLNLVNQQINEQEWQYEQYRQEYLFWNQPFWASSDKMVKSAAILPMFTATFFLFWGIMGIVVIYAAVAQALLIVLYGIRGVLFLLRSLMSLLQSTESLVIQIILMAFAAVFTLLGLIIGAILQISEYAISFVENAVGGVLLVLNLAVEIPSSLLSGLRKRLRTMNKGQDSPTQQPAASD